MGIKITKNNNLLISCFNLDIDVLKCLFFKYFLNIFFLQYSKQWCEFDLFSQPMDDGGNLLKKIICRNTYAKIYFTFK